MDNELFEELEANLKEAVELARGESAPRSVYIVMSPAEIRSIRQSVNMSQAAFARTFQLSIDTVKGWEQGKRKPDTAAANYLRLIKADPDHVRRALVA